MDLYCFSSKTLTNIWAGVGAGLWAVSEIEEPGMKARITKSKKVKVGSCGLFYCAETHSFTAPFIVYSTPDSETIVENIWDGAWHLPFRIHLLGTPNRQVSAEGAKERWPVLRASKASSVTAAMNATGTTVFVPKEIGHKDWECILRDLAV